MRCYTVSLSCCSEVSCRLLIGFRHCTSTTVGWGTAKYFNISFSLSINKKLGMGKTFKINWSHLTQRTRLLKKKKEVSYFSRAVSNTIEHWFKVSGSHKAGVVEKECKTTSGVTYQLSFKIISCMNLDSPETEHCWKRNTFENTSNLFQTPLIPHTAHG